MRYLTILLEEMKLQKGQFFNVEAFKETVRMVLLRLSKAIQHLKIGSILSINIEIVPSCFMHYHIASELGTPKRRAEGGQEKKEKVQVS